MPGNAGCNIPLSLKYSSGQRTTRLSEIQSAASKSKRLFFLTYDPDEIMAKESLSSSEAIGSYSNANCRAQSSFGCNTCILQGVRA